jgi:hypothetical protein
MKTIDWQTERKRLINETLNFQNIYKLCPIDALVKPSIAHGLN